MLLELDLSGAEWVVTAYLCRDPAMLEIAKAGKSPHVVTASRISSVPEPIVLAEEKLNGKVNEPEIIAANRKQLDLSMATFLPRTMSIRQMAKKAGHSGNYRIGYKQFALTYEMEERDAKKIVDLYSGVAYPKLREWWAATDEKIRKARVLTNCFGRRLYLMGALDDDTFKQGYAFVPQSTVVDSCNQAMVRMTEDPSPDFAPAQLLAQVHDSLLTQYPPTDFHAMARFAIKLGLDYMRPVLDYGEPFQLNTDLKVGMSWGKMQEVKLTEDEGKLALALEEAFDACQTRRAA